jgi:hypothetical protein
VLTTVTAGGTSHAEVAATDKQSHQDTSMHTCAQAPTTHTSTTHTTTPPTTSPPTTSTITTNTPIHTSILSSSPSPSPLLHPEHHSDISVLTSALHQSLLLHERQLFLNAVERGMFNNMLNTIDNTHNHVSQSHHTQHHRQHTYDDDFDDDDWGHQSDGDDI